MPNTNPIRPQSAAEQRAYRKRVQALEAEGLCTSDAQAVIDAEEMKAARANTKPQSAGRTHTPGPWQLGKVFTDTPGAYPKRNIYGFDESRFGRIIADDTRAENAERIVACVNACEGISNPEAHLRLASALVKETDKLVAERDALRERVAALEGALLEISRDPAAEQLLAQSRATGHHEAYTIAGIARAALRGQS